MLVLYSKFYVLFKREFSCITDIRYHHISQLKLEVTARAVIFHSYHLAQCLCVSKGPGVIAKEL